MKEIVKEKEIETVNGPTVIEKKEELPIYDYCRKCDEMFEESELIDIEYATNYTISCVFDEDLDDERCSADKLRGLLDSRLCTDCSTDVLVGRTQKTEEKIEFGNSDHFITLYRCPICSNKLTKKKREKEMGMIRIKTDDNKDRRTFACKYCLRNYVFEESLSLLFDPRFIFLTIALVFSSWYHNHFLQLYY